MAELAEIRYFHFKPFEENKQVVGLTFDYDAEIVRDIKDALAAVKSEQDLKTQPGSFLGWCKAWWVEKDHWEDVKDRLDKQHTLLHSPVPEKVAVAVGHANEQRAKRTRYTQPQVMVREGKTVNLQLPLGEVMKGLDGSDLVLDVQIRLCRATDNSITTQQLSAVMEEADKDKDLPF